MIHQACKYTFGFFALIAFWAPAVFAYTESGFCFKNEHPSSKTHQLCLKTKSTTRDRTILLETRTESGELQNTYQAVSANRSACGPVHAHQHCFKYELSLKRADPKTLRSLDETIVLIQGELESSDDESSVSIDFTSAGANRFKALSFESVAHDLILELVNTKLRR